MREEDLFCRRPMGMRMAMIVRQWRAVIDDAILETGLTQSSWTVMMQLKQLGDNVSVSELAEVQGIELPPLMRTLSQLEKQGLSAAHHIALRQAHPAAEAHTRGERGAENADPGYRNVPGTGIAEYRPGPSRDFQRHT